MSAKPVVKWAGGKRQLINKLLELTPKKYNDYFEPFVGGGALLLELMPKNATICDINDDLLNIYRCLANDEYYKLMLLDLENHEKNHSEEYYYYIRELDRKPNYIELPIWIRASRTIYLNKSCFNGLFRVNSQGFFNVPSGKKEKVTTYNEENMSIIHNYFINNNIRIISGDFTDAIKNAKPYDFVYFDPPYDTLEGKDSFTSYTKFNFTKDDQIRLANVFKTLSDRNVYVMLSNHHTELIKYLYKDFIIHIVNAKRMINSNVNGRGYIEEVIVTNY